MAVDLAGASCVTCVFYLPSGGSATNGECRRDAPKPTTSARREGVYEHEVLWPICQDAYWCGEWVVKP